MAELHRKWVVDTTYVEEWLNKLPDKVFERIVAVLRVLEDEGPAMKRPYVGEISGSSLPNLKELRPVKNQHNSIRILFVFDPNSHAVLLVAGDKARQWNAWYRTAIPLAEARYAAYLSK